MSYKLRKKMPLAHFVGIGGVGMSALARWFLAKKWLITGSDAAVSKITRELKKEGVKVKIGHKRANVPAHAAMVIYSGAVSGVNPELREAKKRGITPLSYPRTLGCLTEVYKTIAVSGTHGKSTTTALTSLVLAKAGLDPTVIVGTMLKEFRGKNFRFGKGKLLVIEADEWNRAFHHYHPDIAVVLNIEREHVDTYPTLAESKKAFLVFLRHTKPGGTLVLNRDDAAVRSLARAISPRAKRQALRILWFSAKRDPFARRIARALRIPGAHNVMNALAAAKVAQCLGVHEGTILEALHSYHGAWRRMEYRGVCQVSDVRCKVYDDYAHHPTEIRATLRAFKEKFPDHALICVYQPHQARRLAALYKDFIGAFGDADYLVLLPTYEVLGRDRKTSVFTSERLADDITKSDPRAHAVYLASPQLIRGAIQDIVSPLPRQSSPIVRRSVSGSREPAIIIMMGAGDIVRYTDTLLK